MASITKINKKFRVRYRLYFPDGTFKERSRQVDKMGLARELKALADVLEAKTRLQDYRGEDIDGWWVNIRVAAQVWPILMSCKYLDSAPGSLKPA